MFKKKKDDVIAEIDSQKADELDRKIVSLTEQRKAQIKNLTI